MYSKIASVEVVNFMVFEHARISFDERGIINLKGYNSSGKSTLEKAIAVCLMDEFKRKQPKFIRHGEDFFRVIVEFDDGVKILRDKYINGQSLYEMYKNEELLFSTKEGNRLTRIDGVPDVISTYLGLITLESGCLNYQSRRDPLWLVETVGSENYYALNEVLKTESIARANTLLNSDKNALNSTIAEIEGDLHSVEVALQGCSNASEELLAVLSEREINIQSVLLRSDKIEGISDTLGNLLTLKKIPDVTSINTDRLSSILEIEKKLLELENIKTVPEMKKIETEKLQMSGTLLKEVLEFSDISSKTVPVKIKSVEFDRIQPISRLLRLVNDLTDLSKEKKDIMQQKKSIKENLRVVVEKAHERGIKFVKCDNCGSYMEVGE